MGLAVSDPVNFSLGHILALRNMTATGFAGDIFF
jgi:hypothetical protein